MTEKQFILVCDSNLEWLMQDKLLLPIVQKNNNKQISLKQCYTLLNELTEENQNNKAIIKQLKKSVRRQQKSNEECSKYIEEVVSLLNQFNHELKMEKELHNLWMNEALTSRETINFLKKELAECEVKLQKIKNKQIKADKFVKSKIKENKELKEELNKWRRGTIGFTNK